MSIIKPFYCIRPNEDVVSRVAALPYDVYNREEALAEVNKEELSFLKIDRAETQFDLTVSPYDLEVYDKARETLEQMITNKIFITEDKPCFYLYELVMNGRVQTGLVASASVDDYLNNVIKKHENTREYKELDRIRHVDRCNAHTGPIFLAYRSDEKINDIINETKQKKPLYDFTSPDGIQHIVWKLDDPDNINAVEVRFKGIDNIYIADGHHRAASAVKVGLKRREEHKGYNGDEEFNFFLSVLFPHDQLMIMPYNRAVKDLNGYTKEGFLKEISKNFDINEMGEKAYEPDEKGNFGMYLDNEWYCLKAKEEICNNNDPVESLDVSILQNYLLEPVLGIKDPRTDSRIDFIGGIRGISELEKRVNNDMKVAFSVYSTSIMELFAVADDNMLMPPKSTWFEPKLRSGLFIHRL